jgi:hypothetical protein
MLSTGNTNGTNGDMEMEITVGFRFKIDGTIFTVTEINADGERYTYAWNRGVCRRTGHITFLQLALETGRATKVRRANANKIYY